MQNDLNMQFDNRDRIATAYAAAERMNAIVHLVDTPFKVPNLDISASARSAIKVNPAYIAAQLIDSTIFECT
jgi:hypothetical protein